MDPCLRVDTAGSHGVLRTEGALRQQREISESLKGNAKTPKVNLGPVGERVRRLAGARDLRPLCKVRIWRRIFELLAIGADRNIAIGEIALDESDIFGETSAHLSRIEVEIDSSTILLAGMAKFLDEMRHALELRPTMLSKFELGLSAAGLNPSGASNLDLDGKRPAHHFTPRSPTSYV